MSAAAADVQRYIKAEDGHIEYFVKVFYNGRQWGIRKRFSDFVKLDEHLRRHGLDPGYGLPARTWWNRFDPTVLSSRMKELQAYLDHLLKKSSVSVENSLIREFLDVEANMLDMAKRQNVRQLNYSDRLRAIANETRRAMVKINAYNNGPGGSSSSSGQREREHSTVSPLKKKGSSFSRKISFNNFSIGSRISSPHKLNRTDSMESSASASISIAGKGSQQQQQQHQQHQQDRKFSFDQTPSLSISSAYNNAHFFEAQAAMLDNAKREAFMAHAADLWPSISTSMAHDIAAIDSKTLPTQYYGSQHVAEVLGQPLRVTEILSSILINEMDSFIEAAPKTVLMFFGNSVVKRFKHVDIAPPDAPSSAASPFAGLPRKNQTDVVPKSTGQQTGVARRVEIRKVRSESPAWDSGRSLDYSGGGSNSDDFSTHFEDQLDLQQKPGLSRPKRI